MNNLITSNTLQAILIMLMIAIPKHKQIEFDAVDSTLFYGIALLTLIANALIYTSNEKWKF